MDRLIYPFSKKDTQKDFEKLNNQYQYFINNTENIETYKQLYYICEILTTDHSNIFAHFLDYPELYAYQMRVYFGVDNNIETLLHHFDLYCEANALSNNHLSDIFPKKMAKLIRPIQLPAWQKLVTTHHSPDLLRLFHIAPEIEAALGRVPNNIEEIYDTFSFFLNKREWEQQELMHVISHLAYGKPLLKFIMALNEKHLNILIQNYHEFCNIISAIKDSEIQAALLERIDTEMLQSFADTDYRCESMIKSMHISNIPLFIKKIHIDFLLKYSKDAFNLSIFIEHCFPFSYKQSFLQNDVGYQKLAKYIQVKYDVLRLLELIHYKERWNFLAVIAKEKILPFTYSAYIVSKILDELKFEDRFKFLSEIVGIENLKTIHQDSRHWHEIKMKLPNKDKLDLNKLIYSEEALEAKFILKNIKKTIQATPWSFGMFSTITNTQLGHTSVTVPSAVAKQISQFWAISRRAKSHQEGLQEIKKIGQEAANQYKSFWLPAAAKNFIFQKDETQKYFEKFNNEEIFNQHFSSKNYKKY